MRSALLLLAPLLLVGCRPPAANPEKADARASALPTKVELGTVESGKVPRWLSLTGSVVADKQSEVAANVAGRVTATYVERGQAVKAGDVLARVDAKAATFQAEAASSQAKAAEAQLAQATLDCERADALFAKGALTKADYDRQKTQCSSQIYSANAARSQAELAGKLAGDTTIRAPIDGVVGERHVNVGEYVMPASRVASIFAIEPVRLTISVPESAVGQVREGQTLELEVAAFPGRRFPATVKYLGPALRATTRDLVVEAVAPNAARELRPGMFATVQLFVGDEEALTVPESAIRAEGTVRRLFVVKGTSAEEHVVKLGSGKDGRVAVLEKLEPGTKVVVNPPASLRDGAPLAVQE